MSLVQKVSNSGMASICVNIEKYSKYPISNKENILVLSNQHTQPYPKTKLVNFHTLFQTKMSQKPEPWVPYIPVEVIQGSLQEDGAGKEFARREEGKGALQLQFN